MARRKKAQVQYGPGSYRLVWTPLSEQYELGLEVKGHDLFAFVRSNPTSGGWDYGVDDDTGDFVARGHADTKEEAEAAASNLLHGYIQATLIDPRKNRSYEKVAPADIDGMLVRGEIDVGTAIAYREARERMMLEDMQRKRNRRRPDVRVRGHPRRAY
jgi:hypothetical protein